MLNRKTQDIRGKAISYIDTAPDQPEKKVLFFIHGHSQSSHTFFYQLSNQYLLDHYRLIALDLPGHGESSRLQHYSLKTLALYFSDFVEELGINNFVLLGHGLGAHVIVHSLEQLKPQAIVTWGYAPFTKKPMKVTPFQTDNPVLGLFKKEKLRPSEMLNLYNKTHFLQNKEASSLFMKSLHQVDENFRPAISESWSRRDYEDEVEILQNFQNQKLEFYSINDSIINEQYLKGLSTKVFSKLEELPHSGHFPHTENYKVFNQKISNFLQSLEHVEMNERHHDSNRLREVISAQVSL